VVSGQTISCTSCSSTDIQTCASNAAMACQ
jgi:hypothetical protein